MTIENLILDGQVRKQNNVKTPLSEMKYLLPRIMKLFEDFLACKLNCLKQSLN